MIKYFVAFLQNKINFFNLSFNNEKYYLFYLSYLAFIDVLHKIECLTPVGYFQSTANNICLILELQLKIVKHNLTWLEQ